MLIRDKDRQALAFDVSTDALLDGIPITVDLLALYVHENLSMTCSDIDAYSCVSELFSSADVCQRLGARQSTYWLPLHGARVMNAQTCRSSSESTRNGWGMKKPAFLACQKSRRDYQFRVLGMQTASRLTSQALRFEIVGLTSLVAFGESVFTDVAPFIDGSRSLEGPSIHLFRQILYCHHLHY